MPGFRHILCPVDFSERSNALSASSYSPRDSSARPSSTWPTLPGSYAAVYAWH